MRTIAVLPILLFATAASAADFPRQRPYEPPPPAYVQPVPVWSGFYVGGNIGGGWANAASDFSTTGPVFGTANNNLAGVAGGVQAGYNWQQGPLLLGAEADFQFANLDGSISTSCPAGLCGVPVSASFEERVPWFGTARGRIGYAQDTWLMYATAGYAYAKLETTASASAGGATASLSQNTIRNGWTAGGGIEVALTPRWSIKAEYLYMNFGSATMAWAVPGLPTLNEQSKLDMNVVRTGINYRF